MVSEISELRLVHNDIMYACLYLTELQVSLAVPFLDTFPRLRASAVLVRN